MLAKSDDFGIVPLSLEVLKVKINPPKKMIRKLQQYINEVVHPGNGFGQSFTYQGKPFFAFDPKNFYDYQSYVIAKRTKSEYLKLQFDSETFREFLGNSENNLKNNPTDNREFNIESLQSNNRELRAEKKEKFSTGDLELAELLFTLIKARDPKFTKTDHEKEKWAIDIRKIRTVDRLLPDGSIDPNIETEIYDVIHWCQADDFWDDNILSGGKLRKQFPQLYLKMNKQGKRKSATTTEDQHSKGF